LPVRVVGASITLLPDCATGHDLLSGRQSVPEVKHALSPFLTALFPVLLSVEYVMLAAQLGFRIGVQYVLCSVRWVLCSVLHTQLDTLTAINVRGE